MYALTLQHLRLQLRPVVVPFSNHDDGVACDPGDNITKRGNFILSMTENRPNPRLIWLACRHRDEEPAGRDEFTSTWSKPRQRRRPLGEIGRHRNWLAQGQEQEQVSAQ